MRRRVVFHPKAQRELSDLYDYIAEHGSPERAIRFIRSIQSYCLDFETFPMRGTARDDLAPGLRMVGFGRRVSIVFSVDDRPSLLSAFTTEAVRSNPLPTIGMRLPIFPTE